MDRRTTKAQGRAAPARKTIIGKMGRYRAMEAARKRLREARQAVSPEQEQQPYTAVDKVESYASAAVNETLTAAARRPSPKELMRRAAVKDFKKRREQEQKNAFHGETHFDAASPNVQERPAYAPARREEKPWSQSKNQSSAKIHQSIHQTGQRRAALSRSSSSADGAAKAQLVKEQGRRLARDKAIRELRSGTAKTAAKTGSGFMQRLGKALGKALTPEKGTLLYAAGAVALTVIPFVIVMGVASMLMGRSERRDGYIPVSAEVEAYTPLIQLYAERHGIPEYVELVKAVMMQESGGRGLDPMQASESGFNIRYPHAPNSITDPEYSIDVGVQSLASVLEMAAVESPIDLERISLALQGYNYGPGYITWAMANYGGYSELNAIEFSDMMAARMGWAGYGDKAYVAHVLRYYPIGRVFMGEGNAAMVAVARQELGNVGGLKYCNWWGLTYRVEWCAIFVSWVADQCGHLDTGVLPRMEGVRPYVDWFRERGQWEGRDYEPSPGDIIFFDWESDGLPNHVGIVEKVEDGAVYTIEGNSGDRCAERRYDLASAPIYGYGLPLY